MCIEVQVIEEGRNKTLALSFEGKCVAKVDAWLFRKVPFSSWEVHDFPSFEERFKESERRIAFDYAVKKLAMRGSHSAGLASSLKEKHFSDSAIQQTLEKLKRLNFLDDASYIMGFIQKWAKLGKSSKEIYLKARLQNLPLHEIQKRLAEEEFSSLEHEGLERLIRKRYPVLFEKKGDFLRKQKAFAALGRKGFTFEDIQRIVKRDS
jgi:SOS response regulatory protein OraA/RecX